MTIIFEKNPKPRGPETQRGLFLFFAICDIINLMIKKYFLQILVVLLMLAIAWILVSLKEVKPSLTEALNKPIQASINQSGGDKTAVNPRFFPMRNWLIDEPEISAKSAIIVNYRNSIQKGSVLYQKNTNLILPIASLTKIMTAVVAMENLGLEEIIKVSKKSINISGDEGGLINGEELKTKDLLYVMLVESSNDAAVVLSNDSRLGYENFIDLMNAKAAELGLKNTKFSDPIGLNSSNLSTVSEISELTNYAISFPLISEIFKTSQATIFSIDNKFIHNITTTNKLLEKFPQIIGGKTGFTDEAGGCMVIIYKINENNYLIAVVLGSNQRENDIEKLIDWAQKAWIWQ